MASDINNIAYDDLIGKPFRISARGPDAYDCYGLVREMFFRKGRVAPNYTTSPEGRTYVAQMLSGLTEWKKVEGLPGTMALIRLPTTLHVGFILPYDRMLHCWEDSSGVCVERLDEWKQRVIAYYDY